MLKTFIITFRYSPTAVESRKAMFATRELAEAWATRKAKAWFTPVVSIIEIPHP